MRTCRPLKVCGQQFGKCRYKELRIIGRHLPISEFKLLANRQRKPNRIREKKIDFYTDIKKLSTIGEKFDRQNVCTRFILHVNYKIKRR